MEGRRKHCPSRTCAELILLPATNSWCACTLQILTLCSCPSLLLVRKLGVRPWRMGKQEVYFFTNFVQGGVPFLLSPTFPQRTESGPGTASKSCSPAPVPAGATLATAFFGLPSVSQST